MPDDSLERIACEECGAPGASGASYCEECGASLPHAARAPRPRPTSRLGSDERRELNALFLRTRARLRAVRRIWLVCLTLIVLGALVRFAVGDLFMGTVSLVVAAVYLSGILSIHRFPFGWSLALAGITTLSLVAVLATLDESAFSGSATVFTSAGIGLRVLWVIALWSTVPMTARVAEVMREHGDLYSADRLKGGARRPGHGVREGGAVERHRAERRRARIVGVATIGGVLVLGVAGYLVRGVVTAPRPIEPRVAALEAALREPDVVAIRELALPKLAARGSFWSDARAVLAREGWDSSGVPIDGGRVVAEGETRRQVRYELPRGHLLVTWRRPGRDWLLTGLAFKDLAD